MAKRSSVSKSRTSKAPKSRSPKLPTAPTSDQIAGLEGRAMSVSTDPALGPEGVSGYPASLKSPFSGGYDPRPEGFRQGERQDPAFSSYGISGVARFGAISRVYEEFLKELQGPSGMKYYREMADNDPICGAILFAANHLCRKVSFSFKPANDSNEAKKVADFVGSCIFNDLESSWPDTISEILTMLTFGWSVLEFRFKRRLGMTPPRLAPPPIGTNLSSEGIGTVAPSFAPSKFDDGKIGFRSWGLRSQETLFMWEWDEDSRATVMQQMAPPDYRIRRIPLAKALHFRTQVSKNNPEGRSALRNAFTSYYMVKNLQIFEGIGIERDLAGYPVMQMKDPDPTKGLIPPDIWNDRDVKMVQLLGTLQKIVKSIRRDEQEGLVLPWWIDFKLVGTGSRRRMETNQIIGRYHQRIAMSMMADFIMLGHEAVGSKALAATKISLFTSALSSFLDTMGATIDTTAVPILLQMNGISQELAPTFQHGDVENVNLDELGNFIKNVAGTGFNPLATVEAQKAVMDAAKLPTEDVGEEMPQTNPVMVAAGGAGGPGRANPGAGGSNNKVGDNRADISGGGSPVDAPINSTGAPSELRTT